MKKRIFATMVAIMLVVSLAMPAFAASRNYSDWAEEILERLNAVDSETNLTKDASREEIALIIAYLCDSFDLLPSRATIDFDDDDDFQSSSSYKKIARGTSTGIFCGYPDGEFKPENDITRAEAITMILRMVDYLSLETDNYRRGNSFTDTEGHWAEAYCQRAYEQGLVSGRGNGRFYPDDEITREEVLTIMANLMGESNNPLIAAIDAVYGLVVKNSTYSTSRYDDDDDRYYNSSNRYYDDDDDYEEKIERPVVNTGSSNSSSGSSNSSSKRPERPIVDLTVDDDDDNKTISNGSSRPSRPVVDTTTTESTSSSSVERPTVDVDTEETVSSSRPTRPTV